MANEPAIVVKDLHKEFILPQHKHTSLKQVFVNIGRKNSKKRQKVLDGISFEVNKGDFFGIVGRNGSGKSTLLKILAGVYSPTSGIADVHGNLTPFIELGVGFNPELSGRDNVYLNGALLGFSHKEMDAMYDEIVSFAELGDFMDQKLKNYSSGMQVRLAFSIAVKAHNDVLIFDEVLAVGDEAFQRKCLDIFEQYKANKQTVILVTHDMETVRQFCSRAMLIHDGKVLEIGNPRSVAQTYSLLNYQAIDEDIETVNKLRQKHTIGLKVKIFNNHKKSSSRFAVGDTMHAYISWKPNPRLDSLVLNIYKKSGEHITGFKTKTDSHSIDGSRHDVWAYIKLSLQPGKYYLLIQALTEDDEELETIIEGPEFSVSPQEKMLWSGLVPIAHEWRKPE